MKMIKVSALCAIAPNSACRSVSRRMRSTHSICTSYNVGECAEHAIVCTTKPDLPIYAVPVTPMISSSLKSTVPFVSPSFVMSSVAMQGTALPASYTRRCISAVLRGGMGFSSHNSCLDFSIRLLVSCVHNELPTCCCLFEPSARKPPRQVFDCVVCESVLIPVC